MSVAAERIGRGETRPAPALRPWALSKRWVTLGVIAIELAIFYALLSGGAWVYDDNLIMILARKSGLTWSWLNALIFQHWGLVYHLVFSAQQPLMPFDYRWALVTMLAILGGSIYLVQRVISLLFGWGWRAVLIAGWFGLSVLFVRPLQEWAGGLQYLPNTFFDLLCLYGYIRFQIDGGRRWIALAAAGLAGGLLFYEKPAYMLLYLALIRALLLSDEVHPRSLLRVFWRERLMWLSLAAVTALWAIGYGLDGGFSSLTSGPVTFSQYLDYFRILWLQGFAPAFVGATIASASLDTGQILLIVLLQVWLIAAVAVSVTRKPSAWRAWLMLVVVLILTGVLVAHTRVASFGVGTGADQRYVVDFAWLIPLAVSYAFARRRVLAPALDEPRARLAPVSLLPAAAVGVVAAGYMAIAILTTTMLQDAWAGPQARPWEAHLRSTVGAAQRTSRHPVLADAQAPFEVVSPAFSPFNLLSWVAPLYAPGAQVDGVLDGPLIVVDQNGVARPGEIGARWDDGAVKALVRAGRLSITGALKTYRAADGVCVKAGASGANITRRVRASANAPKAPAYLIASYSAPYPSKVPVYVDSGSGYPGTTDRLLRLAPGQARSILFLNTGTVRRLMFPIVPYETMCLSRLDLVTLEPRTSATAT